jgi:beta-lactamase class A
MPREMAAEIQHWPGNRPSTTGTGGYGTDNDIAILWPPQRSPIVLAVMSTRATADAQPSNALIAAATRTVLATL